MFCTIDFETYYGKGVGFSVHTTEEYINHPEFHEIGMGIRVDEEATEWVVGHEAIAARLSRIDWGNTTALCHNALFDGAILAWRFGVIPAFYFDTLCMARAIHGVEAGGSLAALASRYGLGQKGTEVENALGKKLEDFTPEQLERYGEYCKNDVDLTYALFCKLANDFPQMEYELIDMTLRMFTQPRLLVDDALLVERLDQVRGEKRELLGGLMQELSCEDEEGVRAKLSSNPQFAAILRERGVEVPLKISPATGKETFALAKNDEGFIALQDHDDAVVQQLCAVRLGTKSTLEESRIERFIDIGARNKGKLPIPLKYYGAHTGRWAGCLVDDTAVTVYHPHTGVVQKRIVDVLTDDLVWDGEEFVSHKGVKFSGFAEVITWDGVTGTEDHAVYTDTGQISLREAMQGNHAIKIARSPEACDVEAARQYFCDYQAKDFV